MKSPALFLAIFLAAGCYHVTGHVKDSHEVQSTLLSSKTDTQPLPQKSGIYVQPSFAGENVQLAAERQSWCQDTTTSVYSQTVVGTRELPSSHRILLGTGLGLLAAGTTAAVLGHSMIANAEKESLGEPSAEKRYDQGRLLFPLGLGVGGLGLLIVGSEAYDMITAGRYKEELAPKSKTDTQERVCKRKAAADTTLVIEGAGGTTNVTTDGEGVALVSLHEGTVSSFGYREPFLKVTCPGCKPGVISLPAAQGARFVIRRGNKTELKVWLEQNGHKPEAKEVRAALELAEVEESRQAADVAHRRAKDELQAGNLEEANRTVANCLSLVPAYTSCKDLQVQIHQRLADASLAAARKSMASGKIFDASDALKRCLDAQPGDPRCVSLQTRVQKTLIRIQPDHIKDLAILEEGGGYLVYFSLVNKGGGYVSAAGKVNIFVSMEKDGVPFLQVPIVSFEVKPDDFQARQLGLGVFARPALVVPKLIPMPEFTQNFSPIPGAGAIALRQLAQDADRVLLEIEFTDATGKVHPGHERFYP